METDTIKILIYSTNILLILVYSSIRLFVSLFVYSAAYQLLIPLLLPYSHYLTPLPPTVSQSGLTCITNTTHKIKHLPLPTLRV